MSQHHLCQFNRVGTTTCQKTVAKQFIHCLVKTEWTKGPLSDGKKGFLWKEHVIWSHCLRVPDTRYRTKWFSSSFLCRADKIWNFLQHVYNTHVIPCHFDPGSFKRDVKKQLRIPLQCASPCCIYDIRNDDADHYFQFVLMLSIRQSGHFGSFYMKNISLTTLESS